MTLSVKYIIGRATIFLRQNWAIYALITHSYYVYFFCYVLIGLSASLGIYTQLRISFTGCSNSATGHDQFTSINEWFLLFLKCDRYPRIHLVEIESNQELSFIGFCLTFKKPKYSYKINTFFCPFLIVILKEKILRFVEVALQCWTQCSIVLNF